MYGFYHASMLHTLACHEYDPGVGVDCLSAFFPDSAERNNVSPIIPPLDLRNAQPLAASLLYENQK